MTTEATAETTPPPVDDGDPGESVALTPPPKTSSSGKFSAEVMAKLAELKRNPIITEDDSLELTPSAPPAKAVTSSTPTKAPPPAEKLPAPAPVETPSPTATSDAAAVLAQRDQLRAREDEIAKREAALIERERQYGDIGQRVAADPLGTLREMAKTNLGAGATDAEIDAELTDMLTAASLKLAGAEVDPKDDRAAMRALQREMRQTKAENRRRAAEAEAAKKAAEEAAIAAKNDQEYQAATAKAVETIGREWAAIKGDHAWLSEEDRPSELIWSLISRHHERTGEVLTIATAAKKLDDELAADYRSKFEKRSRLLQPATARTQAPTDAAGHQGDQPRRSRPLTNVDASEDAAAPPPKGFQSVAEMRKEAIKRARPMLAQLREAAAREAD